MSSLTQCSFPLFSSPIASVFVYEEHRHDEKACGCVFVRDRVGVFYTLLNRFSVALDSVCICVFLAQNVSTKTRELYAKHFYRV